MPKLAELTGVTKSGDLVISKSTGTLIYECSKDFNSLTNEKITIWVEREGQNQYLATNILLKDFIYLCTGYEQSKIQAGVGGGNIAVIDFGIESALKIAEGERLKIKLDSLIATDTHIISYVEDYEESLGYKEFEYKSVPAGERDKTFDVSDHEIVLIKNDNSITELGITYSGAKERRFSMYELMALSREHLGITVVKTDGSVISGDQNYLLLPATFIQELRFYTDGSQTIPITLMKFNELSPSKKSGGSKLSVISKVGSIR